MGPDCDMKADRVAVRRIEDVLKTDMSGEEMLGLNIKSQIRRHFLLIETESNNLRVPSN
jgi:hypothetical protein